MPDTTDTVAVDYRDFTRLIALEKAAREYRTAYTRDDIWGDEWTIACVEHRARLFGLLDAAPPPTDDPV